MHGLPKSQHSQFQMLRPNVSAELKKVPFCSPAELEGAKMFPRTRRIGNKKIATNMFKLEFVIHFYSNINCIHMSMIKNGSLIVSYLDFSTVKEPNKSFLVKNIKFLFFNLSFKMHIIRQIVK